MLFGENIVKVTEVTKISCLKENFMLRSDKTSYYYYYHHHHHLPPLIRTFDLFQHRRIAIVSWGAHDLFFLEVCS